jgi:hypothetical protein
MSKRITSVTTITPTATADTTNLVDATYPFLLRGGSATQRNIIYEFYLGGQATVTSPIFAIAALSSTVGTGTNTNGTGQTDAALDATTVALAAPALTGNSNATVKPQRSATIHLHNLSFNAWGGIVLRQFPPTQEIILIGAAAAGAGVGGELTVSAFTGGTMGPFGCHMIYESQ